MENQDAVSLDLAIGRRHLCSSDGCHPSSSLGTITGLTSRPIIRLGRSAEPNTSRYGQENEKRLILRDGALPYSRNL